MGKARPRFLTRSPSELSRVRTLSPCGWTRLPRSPGQCPGQAPAQAAEPQEVGRVDAPPAPAPPRPPHRLHRRTAASPSPRVRLIGNRAGWGSVHDDRSPQTRNICPHQSTACLAQLSLTPRGPPGPAWGTQNPPRGSPQPRRGLHIPAWTPEPHRLPASAC